jgi:radical SAM superfamily enzyme YgiQ (UPF0313 family)/transposase-like protein
MKFLLIMPRFVRVIGESYAFPLGLAHISAVLKQADHEVHCLNLNHHEGSPGSVIEQTVRAVDPDVCGTGGLTPHFAMIRSILASTRRAKPSVVNIVGGGVFSSAPEIVAPLFDIDFGVIGEGEETIVDFAERLSDATEIGKVDGIMFRDSGGSWKRSQRRDPIRDLDSIPWPDYDGFEFSRLLDISENFGRMEPLRIEQGHREMVIAASRSCPFACSFCFHPTGRVYRERDLDNFFKELDYLVDKYEFDSLMVYDELFAIKPERLIEFCDRIKPYNIGWAAQLRVSIATEDVIQRMRDANCVLVSYGLESADDHVLESMGKKIRRVELERALELTYDNKMEIQGNFIFGDAAETLETANNTFDWWARNRKYQINLVPLETMPGSPLYRKALETGRIADPQASMEQTIFNVTDMDDATHFRLCRYVRVLFETILEPAKILAFEMDSETHPTRGDLYKICWKCWRCGAENLKTNVALDHPRDFQNLRFACHSCRSRADVENLARPRLVDAELETLYDEAVILRDSGDIKSAMKSYMQVLNSKFPPGLTGRPEAYIRAAHDVGSIYLATNHQNPGSGSLGAVYWLGEALLYKAYSPPHHIAFANALMAEGSFDGARLHLSQVLKLISPDEPQAEPIQQLLSSLPAAEGRAARYIV